MKQGTGGLFPELLRTFFNRWEKFGLIAWSLDCANLPWNEVDQYTLNLPQDH